MNNIKMLKYLFNKYGNIIIDKEEFIALIKIYMIMNLNFKEIINNINDYFNNYVFKEYLINEKNYLLFEIDNKERKKHKKYNYKNLKKLEKKSLFWS